MKISGIENRFTLKLLGAAALAFCTLQAQAMDVGQVLIGMAPGSAGMIDEAAQEVTFFCAISPPCTEPNTAQAAYADGIFLPIFNTPVALYSFQYGDSGADDYLIGHTLWESGDFALRVDSVLADQVEITVKTVTAGGEATFFQNGVELAYEGEWSLSVDRTSGLAAFSSTAIAREVPEPGTMALLGLGLAGIGAARRTAARRA